MLLFSNIVVKGLGFVYRVLLVRYLGTECIGLVEMASPLFSFLIVLSGLGVQTAMTQSIAQHPEKRFLYLRAARRLLLCTGLLVTLLSYIAAPLLIQFAAPDQRVLLSFISMIPAILIISYASAYRGYLQGLRRMQPIAASQNVEQISRSLLGVFFASQLLSQPLELAAAGPSLATVCGEAAGLMMLLFCLRRNQEDIPPRGEKVPFSHYIQAGKELLAYGLPLTGGRLAGSGIMMLQAMLIPLCLQRAGWDIKSATTLYGQFSGVAMALLHLPGVFTSALSVVIMPAVAESAGSAGGRHSLLGHRIEASLKATVFCTVPGMLLLYLFAEPTAPWFLTMHRQLRCSAFFPWGVSFSTCRSLSPVFCRGWEKCGVCSATACFPAAFCCWASGCWPQSRVLGSAGPPSQRQPVGWQAFF
ncbi:MAG: oligosaccharide flippase family protein [Firmicutes bacterium]|nr:oligosaccharide flippase family protein [Bacillota bacterium]